MSEVVDNQTYPAPADPSGPQGHWLWGTLPEFRRDTLGTLTDWVGRYGDAIRFRYFWRYYAYIFCHPQHNQHIRQQNVGNYTKLPNPINDLLLPSATACTWFPAIPSNRNR